MAGRDRDKEAYMFPLDNINEGISIFRYSKEGDGKAYLEYANRALCNLWNVPFEQIKGAEYEDILTHVHPRDVDKLRNTIHSIPELKVSIFTYRIRDFQTGKYIWLTVRGQYKEDEEGAIACYAYSDISDQIDAVEREQRLTNCIRLITDETSDDSNISVMMRCLREQYRADRAYIFSFDWSKGIMHNTVEVTAENVSPEIDRLQNLPVETVSYWLPRFKAGKAVFIENLEDISQEPDRKAEYDILAVQNIKSLMVVPVSKNGVLYGYMGVDNPHINLGDKEFLTSTAAIMAQEWQNRVQQKRLTELSLRDPLTSINNRHAYNQRIDELDDRYEKGFGIIFTDINGLKYMNDQYGHREGDNLILQAVTVLKKFFRKDDLFRISGDEFVVLVENIAEIDFHTRVEKMKMAVSTEYGGIFSVGEIWSMDTAEVDRLVQRAEEMMYIDKRAFYEKYPNKGRRS